MARKRLLLIDGDETFAQELATAAAGYGFDTSVTTNSTDGCDRARDERPDLVVVNVELAPTNGWSVCTRLKKDDDLRGIPVLLTSSTSTEDIFEKHRKLKTRADEYLLKPYTVDDLVRVAGGLIGLPDPEEYVVAEDALAGDDETLSLGEIEAADDAIAVDHDEPFEDAAVLEETPAEEISAFEDDPLLADDALGDTFDDEPTTVDDDAIDPLAGMGDEELVTDDDLSAFSEQDETTEASAGEDDLAAFEQTFDSITPNGEGDGVTGAHDPSYDEAPLEVPAEDSADGGYDALGSDYPFEDGTGSAQTAELEAKVAQLEAEIEGYRAGETGRDEEAARLREEIARRDREAADLRAQLGERDRTLSELRDANAKLGVESAKAAVEKRKQEATYKALTVKAEQLAALGKKQERDLAQAKEEARELSTLRARVNELEVAAETANEQLFELESTREQLAAVEAEKERLQAEADGLRADLEEARGTAERALGNAGSLQERLDAAEEQARAAQEHAATLDETLAQAREAVLRAADLLTSQAA